MSGDETTQPSGEPEGLKPLPPAPDTDWFLQMLVGMAKDGNNELGVTLFVGGTMISGTITSFAAYLRNLGSEVERATYHTDSGEIVPAETRAAYGDIFRNAAKEAEELIAEQPDMPPVFINLKNAVIVVPGQTPIPGNRRIWWRGRISEVDGFVVGNIE